MGNITVTMDRDADITVFTAGGDVRAEDVKSAIHQFYKGTVTKNVLWDFCACDLSGISSADVRSIAEIPRKHYDSRRGGRTAIVAAKDLSFGLSRMYEQYTEAQDMPFETRTFYSREDAMEWVAAAR